MVVTELSQKSFMHSILSKGISNPLISSLDKGSSTTFMHSIHTYIYIHIYTRKYNVRIYTYKCVHVSGWKCAKCVGSLNIINVLYVLSSAYRRNNHGYNCRPAWTVQIETLEQNLCSCTLVIIIIVWSCILYML